MKIYTLSDEITVNSAITDVWNFFSNPHNLSEITPPELGFTIANGVPEKIYAGALIRYLVTPLFGIKLQWLTEITHCEEQRMFVDEQRVGPYVLWHHQHHFKEVAGGTLVRDEVSYIVPGWILAPLIHRWLILPKLKSIFGYRRQIVSKRFG